MALENVVKEARDFFLREIREFNPDIELFLELILLKANELADYYQADKDIIQIGLYLMDAMGPRLATQNMREKHVEAGVEKTKEILSRYDIDQVIKDKIINCVAAHHGDEKFLSIEAEICANIDCYNFIHPRGVFTYCLILKNKFGNDLDKILTQIEYKLEEKHNIISLDRVKEELEPFYKQFSHMLESCKI